MTSEFGDFVFDILLFLPTPNDVFAIAAQEIVDRFHSYLNRARRFILVEVLETEIRCAASLNDAFDDAIDGGVMSAFEARHFECNQVGMAGRELCRPNLVIGGDAVAVLPNVLDLQR